MPKRIQRDSPPMEKKETDMFPTTGLKKVSSILNETKAFSCTFISCVDKYSSNDEPVMIHHTSSCNSHCSSYA